MGEDMTASHIRISRRVALTASSIAALSLAAPVAIFAAAPLTIKTDGMAGGGSIPNDQGPVNFSVFGSRFDVEGSASPVVAGQLQLLDPAQRITIESLETTGFDLVEGEENSRRMTGFARVSGQGEHPFEITMTDGGPPGSGMDEITFTLGNDGADDTAEVFYSAGGKLETGDLALLTFTFED